MIKANVGCGKRNFGEDWLHYDGACYPHVLHNDVFLTYQPNSYFDLIYSSHLVSYFSKQEFVFCLCYWFGKLKPGGILRIATPDLHKISWMLSNGKCTLPEVTGPIYGMMSMGDKIIFHKHGYDFKTLESILEMAGFTDIKLYDHRKTEHSNTGDRSDFYDDCSASYLHGELISLNVECKKPL